MSRSAVGRRAMEEEANWKENVRIKLLWEPLTWVHIHGFNSQDVHSLIEETRKLKLGSNLKVGHSSL